MKTSCNSDKLIWNIATGNATKVMKRSRNKFYQEKLYDAKGDSRQTYKIINQLLNRAETKIVPEHTDQNDLAQEFETFFINKILNITNELKNSTKSYIPKHRAFTTGFNDLIEFKEVPSENSSTVCNSIMRKYSSVDDIPPKLFDTTFNSCFLFILNIINCSFSDGIFR